MRTLTDSVPRLACGIALVLGMAAALLLPASSVAATIGTRLGTPGIDSYWAYVETATRVYARPSSDSARVARLGLKTSDGTDELVALIAETEDARGAMWVRVRLPVRPNNTTGWVRQTALGEYRHVLTHLHIDRTRFTARLTRRGKTVFTARIGIGKPQWPTPRGNFYVRTRLTEPGFVYGPLAFGTSARSPVLTDWPGGGVIGLHGTNEPHLLPGRVSHGCIRFRNRDIIRLGRLMGLGTPITIV